MIESLTINRIDGFHNQLEPGRIQGATNPLRGAGITADGRSVEVYVKFLYPAVGMPQPLMQVREYVCSLLLRSLGVVVPEPFFATFHPRLIDLYISKNPTFHALLQANSSVNFATQKLDNYADVQPNHLFHEDAHVDACEDIFVADNLIFNADRSNDKPNLLWNAHNVAAIDHGLAFAGIKLGWKFNILPHLHAKKHIAFKTLLRSKPHFHKTIASWIQGVPPSVLLDIKNSIPSCWISTQIDIDEVVDHLLKHDARLNSIQAELKTLIT